MPDRARIGRAKRIVVKVGSSSITTKSGGLADERVDQLVAALAQRAEHSEVVLVSSGAIAAGLAPMGLRRRPRDLPSQQAAASVGQSRLMARYATAFAGFGRTVGQVLLTAEDVTRRSHYNNAQRALNRLLELGVIPIVNENDTVATSEIRFGDNDRLAALVALLVKADALVLLSDVDGLYDGPPTAGAQLIAEVHDPQQLAEVEIGGTGSEVGTGGMATKLDAARIAVEAGIPVLLTSAANVAVALGANPPGTYFHPIGKSRPARVLWLEHGAAARGQLQLDAGAVKAVVERGSSLLPAGVTGFNGEFAAGDAVDLLAPDGSVVARGLSAFDSYDLPGLLGKSTKQLAAEYGAEYERELVHRDDLVLVARLSSRHD